MLLFSFTHPLHIQITSLQGVQHFCKRPYGVPNVVIAFQVIQSAHPAQEYRLICVQNEGPGRDYLIRQDRQKFVRRQQIQGLIRLNGTRCIVTPAAVLVLFLMLVEAKVFRIPSVFIFRDQVASNQHPGFRIKGCTNAICVWNIF